jgi:hypothetical protein
LKLVAKTTLSQDGVVEVVEVAEAEAEAEALISISRDEEQRAGGMWRRADITVYLAESGRFGL